MVISSKVPFSPYLYVLYEPLIYLIFMVSALMRPTENMPDWLSLNQIVQIFQTIHSDSDKE
jgi:hypothetical protein